MHEWACRVLQPGLWVAHCRHEGRVTAAAWLYLHTWMERPNSRNLGPRTYDQNPLWHTGTAAHVAILIDAEDGGVRPDGVGHVIGAMGEGEYGSREDLHNLA